MNEELEMTRYMIERIEKWREWANEMPKLHFNSDWEVTIIPAYAGALVRFIVSKGDKRVSVYFDTLSRLGCMREEDGEPIPYFEIYPYKDDVKRYFINETEELLNDISKILDED